MASKAVQEYYAKKLLFPIFQRELDGGFGQDTESLFNVNATADANALPQGKWVVKPDVCIGKKGKHGLVLVNADSSQAKEFLSQNLGKEVEIGG